ncbi:MAG: hypothetical protein JXX14_21715 [Deltaproteobacteria bacterium]|nr:hypothetical protein [Deltaproteobacteria bacterium]
MTVLVFWVLALGCAHGENVGGPTGDGRVAAPLSPPVSSVVAMADTGTSDGDANTDTDKNQLAVPMPPLTGTDDSETTTGVGSIAYKRNVESYGTFVRVHMGGDELPALDWWPDSKQLFIRWNREMHMSRQVDILQQLLVFLMNREGDGIVHSSVHITMDWYTLPDYAGRLAEFAAGDAEWIKLQKKKPPKGVDPASRLHAYIVATTESHKLLPELALIFEPVGARPRLVHVEKCSAIRPGNRSEAGRMLRDLGIRRQISLPVGCLMATFELLTEDDGAADVANVEDVKDVKDVEN